MSLSTTCYIEVNGIYLDPAAIGHSYESSYFGSSFVLAIPGVEPDAAWDFDLPNAVWLGSRVTQTTSIAGAMTAQEVLTVRTSIKTDRDDVLLSDQTRNAAGHTPAQGWLRRHQRWTLRLLSDTLNVLRVEANQYWLGRDLERVRIARSIFCDSQGETLAIERHSERTGTGRFLQQPTVPSRETVASALEQAARHRAPALPETLVADARYLASRTEYREALMLAAISIETAVKETLQAVASDQQAQLVSLLLDNPRDYSMAASALFDKAMLAVAGRSLREEERALHNRVAKLFEDRNKVAHRGADIDSRTVRRHMDTAAQVLSWLREVRAAVAEESFGH